MSTITIEVDDVGKVSDGYHTFNELYEHRTVLFIAFVTALKGQYHPFKTRLHEDGTMFPGMFMVGLKLPEGQISYHLEERWWGLCEDLPERNRAPRFDGHDSHEVLARLSSWIRLS